MSSPIKSLFRNPQVQAWCMWSLGSLFYFYQYVLRASPCVMAQQIMGEFCILGCSFGILTACFYYTYTLLQLPMGPLLDKMGPKFLLRIAILLCSLGALIFSMATDITIAGGGRLLIGAGASVAFLGAVRLSTLWFPPEKVPLVISLTVSAGTLGGMAANLPIALLLEHFDWRTVTLILSLAGFALGILIWLFVRNGPKALQEQRMTERENYSFLESITHLADSPRIFLIALYGSLMYFPLSVFADAWGVSFLMSLHNIDQKHAAGSLSFVFFGMAVGCPLAAMLSNFFRRRRTVMLLSATGALVANSLLILVPNLSPLWVSLLLFCVGFSMSGQSLVFASGCEYMPSFMSGTVVGAINSIVMLGGALFQPFVGWVLDFCWDGTLVEGAPLYTLQDYQWALSILPAAALASLFIAFLAPETYKGEAAK